MNGSGLERIWVWQRQATRQAVGWPPPQSAANAAREWESRALVPADRTSTPRNPDKSPFEEPNYETVEKGIGWIDRRVHRNELPDKPSAALVRQDALDTSVRDLIEGLLWVAKRNGLGSDPYVVRGEAMLRGE